MKLLARITSIMCMIFLAVTTASGQVANFTADFTAGCAPLVVHFTNTSTGATSYSWTFGNGITSTAVNTSTSYLTPGTYTVTLIAYNGSSNTSHSLTITVYPMPSVNFSGSPTSVCPGVPVAFTDASSGGIVGPLTYAWNFGDGLASTAANPTHAYATPGTYNVTLSVINAQGCVNALTRTAYMHVYTPAAVAFTASAPYVCHAPATEIFTNTTTGTPSLTYAWTFGDGGSSTLGAPTHTYTAPGTYSVALIVTDGNGCTDSLVYPSYISVAHLQASFTPAPATACAHTSVSFYNTSNAHNTSSWNFGDGGTATTDSAIHTYSSPGTYTVTLIVSDGTCTDTITHTVTILAAPATSFVISPAHACPAPVMLSFVGTAPPGSSVTWLYGDGSTGTGVTSTHTYAANGPEVIKMITTSAAGCTDTVSQLDTIYNLKVTITDTPSAGCVPLTVPFGATLTTTTPGGVISHLYPYAAAGYSWDFGDGSPFSTSSNPSHTYTAVGVYNVVLTVTTANGCTAKDTTKVYVGTPPVITFTATPRHVCADQPVVFTATVITGPVSYYVWEYGDGTRYTDSTGTAGHVYVLPGVFSPVVTAYYNGCPSVPVTQLNYITVDSPKSIFTDVYLCSPLTAVAFTNLSLGADSNLWLFGDGTTSTVLSPTHIYPALGTYTAELATYNVLSGCHDTAKAVINLVRPLPDFTADSPGVCRDHPVHFIPTVTGGSATHYAWYVNGVFAEDSTAIFTDTFHVTGLYTISLVITDNHSCLDTVTHVNYEIVAKPVADFSALPPFGCLPLTVSFNDHSTDVPGTTLTSFAWTFGDGGTGTVSTPVTAHTYTTVGTFSVQEIVTDNFGCKDTVYKPALITVDHPHASFYVSNNHPCRGDLIGFVNQSVGTVGSYWLFGDGDTSTAFSPTHIYTTAGVYTVKLVAIDAYGCTDTASYSGYVNVNAPIAAFTLSDSASICAPLLVNFTSTSVNAVSYSWTFGDGNISSITTPSDLYIAPGYYTVQLVATNLFGCTDTAIAHVNIYGYAGAFSYAPLQGCAPLTVSFNASITNVPSIIWDFADGSTSTASAIPTTTHVYAIPGAYVPRLILSDNTGCQSSSPGIDTIKVDAITPGFTTNPTPVCQATTFSFVDTSTSYWTTINSWNWTFAGNTSTLSSPSFLFGTPGIYPVTLTVSDAWGCTGTVTESITVYPPPVIDAGPDTTVCLGDPATLTATGGTSYVWSPPPTLSCSACNPTHATPAEITTYTVTGTDEHGCVSTDTVTVFLKTKTITAAGGGGEVCAGTPLTLFDSGATSYVWIPAIGLSADNIADPVATPAGTITYTVVGQLGSCIPDTSYVTVVVHPLPTVDAGPDQALIAGTPAQLHATGTNIYAYSWSPAQTLDCNTCASPLGSMSVTTTFTVDVTTNFGCTASDSVTINLYCDNGQVFMPNSFTPNGDGQNDVYYPRGTGVSIVKSFRIYNRWGQLLFERENIQLNDAGNAWDGSYGGTTPRPDVYVYVLDAICETGQPLFLKGDVTIIR